MCYFFGVLDVIYKVKVELERKKNIWWVCVVMFFVGFMGGIVLGKSIVVRILKEDFGCVVIDVDVVVREGM